MLSKNVTHKTYTHKYNNKNTHLTLQAATKQTALSPLSMNKAQENLSLNINISKDYKN